MKNVKKGAENFSAPFWLHIDLLHQLRDHVGVRAGVFER